MTNHGDERPSPPAPDRCTIGQLSEQVGMTVRNIRAYQARGLLPPPVVSGRIGFYTTAHRERLRTIRRLRAEGFNLVAISALLTGLVPAVTAGPPGGDELSETGGALLALGIPVDTVLALHREVGECAERLAADYVHAYEQHVREPFRAAGSPDRDQRRVDRGATDLPGLAAAAVTATLVPAMRRRLAAEAARPTTAPL
jgi:DNA-binding transcriptional MerR regulator